MPERKKLYMRILQAELRDCIDDLSELSKGFRERFECQEIGNYVNCENQVLLCAEIRAVEHILLLIDQIDDESYDSVETLHREIEAIAGDAVEKGDYPPAVASMIKRRTVKVLDYIKNRSPKL